MFQIDLKSHKSIQEQISDNFMELIVAGILKPDEKLPSVRELSKMLTVNPNTVQKAYTKLEEKGYVYVVKGKGSFVSNLENLAVDMREVNKIKKLLKEDINKLYYTGISKNSAKEIVDDIFDERGEWEWLRYQVLLKALIVKKEF